MAPPNGPSSTYGRSRQIVAAPTQPAEWVALYTYPSSAALYSQLPTSEAALAPISARAPGIAKMSRYVRAINSPLARPRIDPGGTAYAIARGHHTTGTVAAGHRNQRRTGPHPLGRTGRRTRHHQTFIPRPDPPVYPQPDPPGHLMGLGCR